MEILTHIRVSSSERVKVAQNSRYDNQVMRLKVRVLSEDRMKYDPIQPAVYESGLQDNQVGVIHVFEQQIYEKVRSRA